MAWNADDPRLAGIESIQSYPLIESVNLYNVPPPPMLVESVQPKGTITGLTGAPGVGKTWFALDMCRAVSTGTKFLGMFPTVQGACLYVGSDASMHDYARQWRRLTLRQWGEYNSMLDENDTEHTNPIDTNMRFLIQSPFMLDNTDAIRRIIQTNNAFVWGPYEEHFVFETEFGPVYEPRRRRGFDLIIFDTYSKLIRGNQNDNTLTEEAFRNIRLVCEVTGAACIILHHNSYKTEFNDGEQWRGASSAPGALDNHVQLTASSHEKYVVQAKFKKFRGITPEPFFFELNVNDEETASLTYTVNVAETEATWDDELTDNIIGWLSTPATVGQWFTLKQIASALHEQYKEIFPNAKSFEDIVRTRISTERKKTHPRILQDGGGGRGRRAVYMVSTREVPCQSMTTDALEIADEQSQSSEE